MLTDWSMLSDETQFALSREARRHIAQIIADQAESLAASFESGRLTDRGGAAALRLLAAAVRITGQNGLHDVGHA